MRYRIAKSAAYRGLISVICVLCFSTAQRGSTPGISDDYVPGEVTVVLKPDVDPDGVAAQHGSLALERIENTNAYRFRVPAGSTVKDFSAELKRDSNFISADPNTVVKPPEIRQVSQAFVDQISQAFVDKQYPAQFYGQSSLSGLHIAEALNLATGAGVTVAVIDTGIDFDHPLFAGRLSWPNQDFVDGDSNPSEDLNGPAAGHGTFIAGLIALAAPGAKIMPLRAFAADGTATTFSIAKAIRFACDHGANVINMSFGVIAPDGLLKDTLTFAHQKTFLISSAGNDNLDFLQFPGVVDSQTLSVGATTSDDRRASFSNYNQKIGVVAPGEQIYSAYPGGRWAYWSGTSFSTALVSAEAAQLLSLNPTLNRSNLGSLIKDSGVNIDSLNPGYSRKLGRRIDFLRSVQLLQSRN